MSVRTRIRSFERQSQEVSEKAFPSPRTRSIEKKKDNPFSSSNYREDSPARTSGSSSSNASYTNPNKKDPPVVAVRKSSPASRKNAMSGSPSAQQQNVASSTSSIDGGTKSKSIQKALGKEAAALPGGGGQEGRSGSPAIKAKQNRKSRIQREVEETTTRTRCSSPAPIVAGSLKQRRNMMKYQKQRAREQHQQTSNSNHGSLGSGSGRGVASQSILLDSNHLGISRHSNNSSPAGGLSSGRRFVHSLSQESNGEMNVESSVVVTAAPEQSQPKKSQMKKMKPQPQLQRLPYPQQTQLQPQQQNAAAAGGGMYDSPSRYSSAQIAKSHRMQRMRNNANNINYTDPPGSTSPGNTNTYKDHQPRPYETSPSRTTGAGSAPASPVLYTDDNTEFNSLSKSPQKQRADDDDDATLTSVRQIMGGADHQPTTSSSLISGITSSTLTNQQQAQQQQQPPPPPPIKSFNHDGFGGATGNTTTTRNRRNGKTTSSGVEEQAPLFTKRKKLSRGSGRGTGSTNNNKVRRSSSRGSGGSSSNNKVGRTSSRKSHNILMRAASSSDYDSDGAEDRRVEVIRSKSARSRKNEITTDSAMDVFLQKTRSSRVEEDERTFDYGELNDSVASFDTTNRHALKQANVNHDGMKSTAFVTEEPRPLFVNNDDLKFYTKKINTPVVKTTAGVMIAATVGAVVMGPVGLLVGAAAVGIGIGAMQVPEEQRDNVREKVTAGVVQASDAISSSCVTMCHQTGVSEHIPPEIARCYDPDIAKEFQESQQNGDGTGGGTGSVTANSGAGGVQYNTSMHDNDNGNTKYGAVGNKKSQDEKNQDKQSHTSGAGANIVNNAMRGLMPDNHGNKDAVSRRAMCQRDVRIVPVSQIYGLQPSQQPRAWLDVMACAHTSMDEKNEAMEEICIIAKDKNNAAILLQEGILDSFIWILTRHLDKLKREENKVTPREVVSAKLAASCCVTLGKAHCALVHTGGDLLLMSMYEHGKVPEERQLAQMLYETPHHHPVVTDSSSAPGQEQFAIKNLVMHEAQELARSIKQLTDEW